MQIVMTPADAYTLACSIENLLSLLGGMVTVEVPAATKYGVLDRPSIHISYGNDRGYMFVDGLVPPRPSPYYTPSELAEFVIWPLRFSFIAWAAAFNRLIQSD